MAVSPNEPSNPKKPSDKAAAQEGVFLREVDDALREDEMMGFFKRYGLPLIAIVLIGLVALGGYLWWENNRKDAADARGEQFIVALDQLEANNLDGGDEKLAALVQDEGTTSAVAANLLRAGIALQQDRGADAIKIYAAVAADPDAPQPYRDLASVREVAANFDNMKPQAVIDRLKPLAAPGNPWFGVAGELVGMAYLKQGKEDLAGPLFAQIARDEDLPDSLRGRSRQLAGLLGVDAIDDVIEDKNKVKEGGDDASSPKAAPSAE